MTLLKLAFQVVCTLARLIFEMNKKRHILNTHI